jgi:hypothetical protein
MEPVNQPIYDFMAAFVPQYINPHGVAFTLNSDKSVYVVFAWDDKLEDECLEFGIAYSNKDFNTFLKDFNISSIQQLKSLTKAKLWELYHTGKGEVYCSFGVYFNNSFELHFHSKGNTIIASNEEGEDHEVHELLRTPRQFMQYTYACNVWPIDQPHI